MRINKLVILCCLMALISSCSNKTGSPKNNDNIVNDSILAQLPKAVATEEEICDELKLNGRIVPDEAKQASVYALVSGRISQVNVELGDYVKKGQTLAVLKSAEVAGVNNELALARSNVEIACKNMDSYQELYESKLVAEREYIAAKTEYQKALSELEKAEHIASITGGENSAFVVKAPLNGYIIAKNITNNSEVRSDMAEPLFSIADLSVVWILADVFEVDIRSIRLGQNVEVNTLSNSGKTFSAKIDKIYNVLDPETRTMKVRASINNMKNEFMPGMFVTVKVNVNESRRAVTIPNDALVMDSGKNYVVILNNDNKPEIRKIEDLQRTGNKCYVKGVEAGETVITGSQVFLFEALNNEQITR